MYVVHCTLCIHIYTCTCTCSCQEVLGQWEDVLCMYVYTVCVFIQNEVKLAMEQLCGILPNNLKTEVSDTVVHFYNCATLCL